MRKGTWWRWLVGLLVIGLLVAGGVILRGRAAKGTPIDPTLLAKVSRGELEIAVVELGKIEPREKVAIKSKVAGQVEKMLVEEGMTVKTGQLLLILDPTEFQRSVVRAQQEIDKAQARAWQALEPTMLGDGDAERDDAAAEEEES